MIRTVNPATGREIRAYEEHGPDEVEARVARAAECFATWRARPLDDRARLLDALGGELEGRTDALARTLAMEMGKPIAEARAEVQKSALGCRHYAEHAAAYLAEESIPTEAASSVVRFDPLGPVLAIMPWNFPVWQVVRFAAPALAAGNTVLLKHAPIVTGCALAIEAAVRDAGFPHGGLQLLVLPDERVGEVIDDERVAAVTLTGSVRAGSAVAARAGRAVKKTVLELGGSDPLVVLADADLDRAADAAVRSRMQNSGQSCIAAKRVIVDARVHDALVERLAERIRALVVGNPLDERTEIGPLARADLRETLERQLEQSLRRGARLVAGGRRPGRPGFFVEPTLVTGAEPGMPIADEETFGPLAVVLSARDEGHALALANRTPFGLGASVWTADPARGRELALRIDAGSVFVNAMVHSDPRLPFGGVKRSGYGRELGREGIREFVNTRTVVVG